jgi:ferredoxin
MMRWKRFGTSKGHEENDKARFTAILHRKADEMQRFVRLYCFAQDEYRHLSDPYVCVDRLLSDTLWGKDLWNGVFSGDLCDMCGVCDSVCEKGESFRWKK